MTNIPPSSSQRTVGVRQSKTTATPASPCVLVIFGASGDLTKRLLVPALYNLACDGLLPKQCAIIGTSSSDIPTQVFRDRMSTDIQRFSTRKEFNQPVWDDFVSRLYYTAGKFDDPAAYQRLGELIKKLDAELGANGNVLFYMAVPPSVFGLISTNLDKAGFTDQSHGWKRMIVEKPFGHDLSSALQLNKEILDHWSEDQVFRIDHYLGKETVQNILAFRFSNGMFEPLWNKQHIDHIQFTVAETVGVESRGKYYDTAGVLRDMIQNHMFQMLAYLCMEPPSSFKPDSVRNEKAKVLDAVRVMTPEQVMANTVRGQYGPAKKADGTPVAGYRHEPDVNPTSPTETFAALRLYIDNWRWEGVPIFLRSGKALWKRGTEVLVQFKKAPEVIFRDTPEVGHLDNNQLIFHIQPDQGIELRFQAKSPGPLMALQKVNMRFDYREAFEASRGTGYELLIYNCMIGDATLFSRTDLVEAAWRIAQPVLDTWAASPPDYFPNYEAGTWGPKAAFELLSSDGRKWLEVINRAVLEQVPLFQGASPVFLHSLALMLKPVVFAPGDFVVREGEPGREMYFVARGDVEITDRAGKILNTLSAGSFFGEMSLLLAEVRSATVRAKSQADLYVLDRTDFAKVAKDHPNLTRSIIEISKTRYGLTIELDKLFTE
ncbi:MAG: glucose-6-phosphate dehydrogenase [Deltaproteobacteria bacterium]|nr:glucose-6-phosphate dehydrogenase [Deltaproteobacteria bacterium]